MEGDQLQNVTADCHRLIMGLRGSNCRIQKRGNCRIQGVTADCHRLIMGQGKSNCRIPLVTVSSPNYITVVQAIVAAQML